MVKPLVGIVIPTINRPEFVIRQLSFYARTGGRIGIYIGDGSEGEGLEKVAAACERFSKQLKIVHLRLPGSSDVEAERALVKAVEEPFACLLGDDDFFIPSSLERCADFLTGNPDYAIALGKAALFQLSSEALYGDIVSLVPYNQRSLESSTASERLLDYFYRSFATHFSVHRTDNFRKEMEAIKDVNDRAIREILSSALAIVHGKAKQLDRLYLVREDHAKRYLQADVYDILTHPRWQSAYQILFDVLTNEVAEKDDIPLERARDVVKQGFWAYTARALNYKWNNRYGRSSASLRQRLSKVAVIANSWHKMRSFIPAERHRISLHALLRRSSKYNDDFALFHDFITGQVESREQ